MGRRKVNVDSTNEDGQGPKMAAEIPYKDIGLRVRTLREANDYTRDAFAEKIEISTKFLYEIEMGKKGFSVEILYKISQALCVSNDYLLTGNEIQKVPDKIVDILEGFTPSQLTHIHEILKWTQELTLLPRK